MYMYVQVHVCACAHLKHRGQRSVSGVIPQELPTLFFGFVFVMDGVSHWGQQCSNLAALPSEPSPTSAFSFMALRFSPAILWPFCMFESFSFSVNMWGSMTKTVKGWRDGSAGKSTGWSSRGSRFGSRYPHSYVQPSITIWFHGIRGPLLTSVGLQTCDAYMQGNTLYMEGKTDFCDHIETVYFCLLVSLLVLNLTK